MFDTAADEVAELVSSHIDWARIQPKRYQFVLKLRIDDRCSDGVSVQSDSCTPHKDATCRG